MTNEHQKYAPSLAQLESAAAALPDPKVFLKDTFDSVLDSANGKIATFEKMKFKKPDGKSTFKWTFKGRIIIDSKFISER